MQIMTVNEPSVELYKQAAEKLDAAGILGPFIAGINQETFLELVKEPEFASAYANAYGKQPVCDGARFVLGNIVFMVAEAVIAYKKK